jgi:signal transduction histidine kinase
VQTEGEPDLEAVGTLPGRVKLAVGSLMLAGLGGSYWLGSILIEDALRNRLVDLASVEGAFVQAWIQVECDDIQQGIAQPLFGPEVTLQDDKSTPPQAILQEVRTLNALVTARDYDMVAVRDPATGLRWIGSGAEPDDPDDIAEAREIGRGVDRRGQVKLGRPGPRSVPQQALKLFQLVTVTGRGQQAVMQFNVPVEDLFLRHFGTAMPAGPDTVRTLLMQRDGNQIMVLHDSQAHGHDRALRRIDAPEPPSIWSALQLQRDQGFVRGRNDAGDAVLAFAAPVAQTNWVLVTVIQERRIMGQLNAIFLLASAMAGCVLMVAARWWRSMQRQNAASSRLARERARHAEQLAEFSEGVVTAQEAERHHLAMELHDHIGADLATIALNLKHMERNLGNRQADGEALLKETNQLLANTVLTVREFCTQLRPSVLDYAGLDAALQACIQQLKRRTGIEVVYKVIGEMQKRPAALELPLFRIAQEALLNCERHAAARKLRIELREDERGLGLEIEDDGCGFDATRLGRDGQRAGLGIANMRHRATLAGGRLHIRSAPGQGTCVHIELHGA